MVPAEAKLTAAGFHEPSLVFLHGTDTALRDGDGAAVFLERRRDGWAAVEAEADGDFQARLRRDGEQVTAVGAIDGFNYSRGRPAHIRLYRLTERAGLPGS
jgi:hypothetical protein